MLDSDPGILSPSPQRLSLLSRFHMEARRGGGGGGRVLKGHHTSPQSPQSPHILSPAVVPGLASRFFLGQSRTLLSGLNLHKVFAQSQWDARAQPVQPKGKGGLVQSGHTASFWSSGPQALPFSGIAGRVISLRPRGTLLCWVFAFSQGLWEPRRLSNFQNVSSGEI